MTTFRFTVVVLAPALAAVACSHARLPVDVPTVPAPVAEEAPPALEPTTAAPAERTTDEAAPGPVDIAPASIYFGFDSADLTDDTLAALQKVFEGVRQRPDVTLRIEGNCDERGTVEYNLLLGQRRADAAKAYLANLGLDASRVTTLSYGKERPRADGHDEAAWRENRRDDLLTPVATASNGSR